MYQANGQWVEIFQSPGYFHQQSYFLNPDTGFVVGHSNSTGGGYIFRTKDGGATWDSTNTFFGNFSISFPNAPTGYTGGHDGRTMKTIDMGDNWIEATAVYPTDYSNHYYFSPDTGFVVQWSGVIAWTFDGANSWSLDTTIGGYSPYPGVGSIQFINDTTGIIAAGKHGTFARTSNRGSSWTTQSIDSSMWVTTIEMKNESVGFAVGASGEYSTTLDGGLSWASPTVLTNYRLHDIAFFNDTVGYAVGGNTSGTAWNNPTLPIKGLILKTTDGGSSWSVLDSSYDDIFVDLMVVNENVGYIVGNNGRILKTQNALSTQSIEIPSKSHLISVFPNPSSGIINITSETIDNYTLRLFNHTGQLINSINLHGNSTLDLSDLPSGTYYYSIILPDQSTTQGTILFTN